MTALLILARVLLAAAVGAGVALVVTARLPRRTTRIERRLEGFLDPDSRARAVRVDRTDAWWVAMRRHLAGRLAAWLGGDDVVAARLRQAADPRTVAEFRGSQVVGALVGAVVGMLLGLAPGGAPSAAASLAVMAGSGAVGGMLVVERALIRRLTQRGQRQLAELPVVADLLALGVAAGQSPLGAMGHVAERGVGELSGDLTRVLAEVRTGTPVVAALAAAADATCQPAVRRMFDAVATSLDRGSPLAEVLAAQAVDARDARRRWLMEAGGQREIAMLVPVVFLVLPVTVLFALYPGLLQFETFVP